MFEARIGRFFRTVLSVVLLLYRSVNHTLGKLAGVEFEECMQDSCDFSVTGLRGRNNLILMNLILVLHKT